MNKRSNKGVNPILYGLMIALIFFAEYMVLPIIVVLVGMLGIQDIVKGDVTVGCIRVLIGTLFLIWYTGSLIKEFKKLKKEINEEDIKDEC